MIARRFCHWCPRLPAHPLGRRAGWPQLAAAVLGTFLLAVLALSPAAAAGGDPSSDAPAAEVAPSPIRVTGVDAATAQVELAVIGAPAATAAADVTLSSGDEALDITGVTTASAAGRARELVLVVDTNTRGIDDSVLESVKAELATALAALEGPVSVAVVSAGDSALVESRLSTDQARTAAALAELAPRNGAALFNAVQRAAELFSSDPGVIRSVVVVSTGSDLSSDTTLARAQVPLVANGIQLVSVRYQGGEPSLSSAASETAGLDVEVASPGDLAAAVSGAVAAAAERTLVTFAGEAESGSRVNLHLEAAGAGTELSYPAGVVTSSPLQLREQQDLEPSGFAFFRSSIGLYVSLVLAFVGISLGLWSLGSIMAGGDTSLEGLLSRYADGRGEVPEGDVEELIVQSALLKRAITFSESFAEKRGFLVRVEDLLEKASLPIRAGEAMFALAAITAFTTIFGLLLTRSLVAGLLLGVFAVGMSFFVVKFLGRRRFKKFESLLPDTLQLLSGTLRAGYSLPQGMEVVSREIADPMGQELRRAMTEARLGRELEECLAGVAERMSSADFAWAVMAIGIQREVGGNLNELLTSVADTMIARERLRREVGALTAEGRMSAGILSCLPPGLGLIMWIMNPGYIALLFTDFIGNVLLGLGTVSALVGLAWMKKVITIDV
jgi:tight adherence protein B